MRKIAIMTVAALAIGLSLCGSARALDENAPSLGFLPPDATTVIAVDVDSLNGFGDSVMNGWRPADKAHFLEGLRRFPI